MNQDCFIVATIAERGQGFIQETKSQYQNHLITINNSNRNDIPNQLLHQCLEFIKNKEKS